MTDEELVLETAKTASHFLSMEGAARVANGREIFSEALPGTYAAFVLMRQTHEALVSRLGFLRAVAKAAQAVRQDCGNGCYDEDGFPRPPPFQRCAQCDLNYALLHLRASDHQQEQEFGR